jgi:hypothetical protein
MIRIKIMLFGLLVLAVIAGALAFKTKKSTYCLYTLSTYTTIVGGPIQTCCPLALIIDPWAGNPAAKKTTTKAFTTEEFPCPPKTNTTNCTRQITYQLED